MPTKTKTTTTKRHVAARKTTKSKKSQSKKFERGWLWVGRRSKRSKSLPTLAKQRFAIIGIYAGILGLGSIAAFGLIGGVFLNKVCQDEISAGTTSGQCVAYASDIIAGYTGVIEGSSSDVASVNVVSAIKKFQKANNLPETGKLDTTTWNAVCRYGLSMNPSSQQYKSAVKAGCSTTVAGGGNTNNGGSNSGSNGSTSGGSSNGSGSGGGAPSTGSGSGSSGGSTGGSSGSTGGSTGGGTSQPSTGSGGLNASNKPTDASTGPRVAITSTRAGGSVSGTFSQVRFTSAVEIPAGAAVTTLTDCVIDGQLSIKSTNLVIIDHCDINGWFGHRTDNKDKSKQLLIVRHSKFVGATNNDAVRFANTVGWGDQSTFQNTLVEDSIFHSPYVKTPGAHFDLIQFGGGANHVFNRVLLSYTPGPLVSGSGAVSYVNNDTQDQGVVFNDLWIEGGGVSYVLRGGMTVNNCLIASSAAGYGYVGGNGSKLNNCYDTNGKLLSGKS